MLKACFLATGLSILALALSPIAAAADTPTSIQPTAADAYAAAHVSAQYRHAHAAQNPGLSISRKDLDSHVGLANPAAAAGASNASPLRYPGDLTSSGGPVVKHLVSHPIYLDGSGKCTSVAACWGDPQGFLKALGDSNFIHVVDQYVGAQGSDRYTVTRGVKSSVPSGTLLTDNDILALVHAVASNTHQTGYGHEYHVFLAPGTDECFDSTYTVCYSPDNFPTFYFCAYHGSVDFSDIGHVLYSVEPYQKVPGCADTGAQPNGQLVDSTNNVLSHELFETITDPDPPTGWTNLTDNGLFGQEIGDECSFVNATGFDPSVFYSDGRVYAAQPEYSNSAHACASSP